MSTENSDGGDYSIKWKILNDFIIFAIKRKICKLLIFLFYSPINISIQLHLLFRVLKFSMLKLLNLETTHVHRHNCFDFRMHTLTLTHSHVPAVHRVAARQPE